MFDNMKMLQCELSFPRLFTNMVTFDWGIAYYTLDNPQSHDSNHAHILDLTRANEATIREVTAFYCGHGLQPRINGAFIKAELAALRPLLEGNRFTVDAYNNVFMRLRTSAPEPRADAGPEIRRIAALDQDVTDLVLNDDGGVWSLNVLKSSLKCEDFHLLGLYYQDKCVSMASVQLMNGYSRIDQVRTHTEFRGRRFGTQLIKYLTAYHASISANCLYLYSGNPIAIGMYRNCGFEEIPLDVTWWAASA